MNMIFLRSLISKTYGSRRRLEGKSFFFQLWGIDTRVFSILEEHGNVIVKSLILGL